MVTSDKPDAPHGASEPRKSEPFRASKYTDWGVQNKLDSLQAGVLMTLAHVHPRGIDAAAAANGERKGTHEHEFLEHADPRVVEESLIDEGEEEDVHGLDGFGLPGAQIMQHRPPGIWPSEFTNYVLKLTPDGMDNLLAGDSWDDVSLGLEILRTLSDLDESTADLLQMTPEDEDPVEWTRDYIFSDEDERAAIRA